jgi:hypothetical protein
MLSIAILVHAFVRPAPLARLASSPAAAAAAAVSISPAEVQSLIQAAVSRSVRESEARQEEKTQKLVADSLQREEQERIMLARAEDFNRYLERSGNARKVAAYRPAAETRALP